MFQLLEAIYDENGEVIDFYFRKVDDNFVINSEKSREEIIGKTMKNVFGIIVDYWIENLSKVVKTGEPSVFKAYSAARNKYFDTYSWKVNDREIGSFLIDVSLQKKNELLLQQSKEEIQKLNASKERLVSIIAHDLRCPFNAILGFSNLLIDNVTHKQDLEETLNYSKIIYGKAKETLVLLDNLLDYGNLNSKYVHFNPTKVLLSSVIGHAVKSYLPDASLKNISLTFNAEKNFYVYVDETMLKSIAKNLISNALKFSHLDCIVTVFIKQIGDDCKVIVSDNGVGIPVKKQADLFSFKTNRTTRGTLDEKGTGLGLLICKEYLEKNNGSISMESVPGKGSTFTFTLPLIAS
jgi:signal transduction histidine kinase